VEARALAEAVPEEVAQWPPVRPREGVMRARRARQVVDVSSCGGLVEVRIHEGSWRWLAVCPYDGRARRDSSLGDGTHKLPVKADVRRAIGKSAGDTVVVRLEERIG
jgi:hypothetical protein